MPPIVSEQLQYPIGRFTFNPGFSAGELSKHLLSIEQLPGKLDLALAQLSEAQWDQPYRPGGWSIRQVVHHLADSHLNAFVRFKLALTEQKPAIKPYMEDRWADLSDSLQVSPMVSLQLLQALHTRWVALMQAMEAADWQRLMYHPERMRDISLWDMVALYAWHGEHHLAHVKLVL
jgi:uncharacterized damage-inducible protein DinB